MKASLKRIAALAVACTLVSATDAIAQNETGWTGTVGNWTDNTWAFVALPDPSNEARALFGSTATALPQIKATGEVSVTTDLSTSNPSPTVVLGEGVLGDGGGASGILNITSSGHLKVVEAPNGSTGVLSVGTGGGLGVLNVEGTLEVDALLESRNTADGASTITLSGSATVTTLDGFMDRQFVVDGSNVSATFTRDLFLGGSGAHTWKIPATGASTLLVGNNADLNGTLRLEFPDGAPSIGGTWNLIDSAVVDNLESPPSGFASIDQSAVTGLNPGARFAVTSVADGGSVNGVYTQLSLEQHPVLVIDRSTGAASFHNHSSTDSTVDFDVYLLGSAGGHLNSDNWTSIAPSNGWVASGRFTEVNPTGSESLAPLSSISLGTPFIPPAAFGDENEDVTFQFAKPTITTSVKGSLCTQACRTTRSRSTLIPPRVKLRSSMALLSPYRSMPTSSTPLPTL